MRQGQQNRRGRNRSGRKPQSALSRNFESNGPNVKIRGTASHIAEKYLALARDAQSSGDIIVAESYFQHAEHYNRIIMSAQAEKQNGAERQASAGGNGRDHGDEFDMEGEDEEPAQGAEGGGVQPQTEPEPAKRRRKPANGAGRTEAKADASNGDGQKPSRGSQTRRKRQKVETTPARAKPAQGNNGASAGADDGGASEGFSA
jgi:hypothetical protein